MLRGIADDDRRFIGRDAIRRELADGTSRFRTTGLVVDWNDWDRVHDEAGLIPPKDHTPVQEEMYVYDDDGAQVGYATSFMYSPVLQRHIAIARVPARRRDAGHEAQPRDPREPPLRPRDGADGAHCRSTTRPGRRPDMSKKDTRAAKDARETKDGGDVSDHAYDAIIVGGGHNGLVNGAYLAKAGLHVLILERRHLVGGAAITEELWPGFSFTTFSYALSLLRPEIIHELDLVKHGFMPLLMSSTFAPMENGDYLLHRAGPRREPARDRPPLPHDADAYDRFDHDLNKVLQAFKPLMDAPPPNLFSDDPEELLALAGLGARFKALPKDVLHNAVRLLTGSAADFLDDYFE